MDYKKQAPKIAGILLGLIYVVFALNGIFMFLPLPQPVFSETALAFIGGMMGSGYFFPLLMITEIVFGALLLFCRATPLALVVLAPLTLNIFLFHAFLTPGLENMIIPVVMAVLHVVAAYGHWKVYRPLFFTKG